VAAEPEADQPAVGIDGAVRQRGRAIVLVSNVDPGRTRPVPCLALKRRRGRGAAARGGDELAPVRVGGGERDTGEMPASRQRGRKFVGDAATLNEEHADRSLALRVTPAATDAAVADTGRQRAGTNLVQR